jgi:hypothetical protein
VNGTATGHDDPTASASAKKRPTRRPQDFPISRAGNDAPGRARRALHLHRESALANTPVDDGNPRLGAEGCPGVRTVPEATNRTQHLYTSSSSVIRISSFRRVTGRCSNTMGAGSSRGASDVSPKLETYMPAVIDGSFEETVWFVRPKDGETVKTVSATRSRLKIRDAVIRKRRNFGLFGARREFVYASYRPPANAEFRLFRLGTEGGRAG